MSLTSPNVLWEIQCSSESTDGFHSGADVSMLSQFCSEKEVRRRMIDVLPSQVDHSQVDQSRVDHSADPLDTYPTRHLSTRHLPH
jgi:hypothetical protein